MIIYHFILLKINNSVNISCDLVTEDVRCDKTKDVSRSFLSLTNPERHVQYSANMALVSLAVVPMVTGP